MTKGELSQPLTCQELVELVSDYLEDMLSPDDRARFDAHLGTCTGCRNYLNQMRRTIQTIGHLSEADVPPAAERELLETFRDWYRNRSSS